MGTVVLQENCCPGLTNKTPETSLEGVKMFFTLSHGTIIFGMDRPGREKIFFVFRAELFTENYCLPDIERD